VFYTNTAPFGAGIPYIWAEPNMWLAQAPPHGGTRTQVTIAINTDGGKPPGY